MGVAQYWEHMHIVFPDHLTGRHSVPYPYVLLQNTVVRYVECSCSNVILFFLLLLCSERVPQYQMCRANTNVLTGFECLSDRE
jgi:hypothetical protein